MFEENNLTVFSKVKLFQRADLTCLFLSLYNYASAIDILCII